MTNKEIRERLLKELAEARRMFAAAKDPYGPARAFGFLESVVEEACELLKLPQDSPQEAA